MINPDRVRGGSSSSSGSRARSSVPGSSSGTGHGSRIAGRRKLSKKVVASPLDADSSGRGGNNKDVVTSGRSKVTTISAKFSVSSSSSSTSRPPAPFSHSPLTTVPTLAPRHHNQEKDQNHSSSSSGPIATKLQIATGDDDSDFVHWQSSQVTNPALRSLLKDASSESFDVRPVALSGSGLDSLATRLSPPRQHAQPKSNATTSLSNNDNNDDPSKLIDQVPRTHSTRLRTRHSITSPDPHHTKSHYHELQQTGKSEPNSPFISGDPNKMLEMMRGVSAMIDESTRTRSAAVSTPLTVKTKAKGVSTGAAVTKKAVVAASAGVGIGRETMPRSRSSMDVVEDVEMGRKLKRTVSLGDSHHQRAALVTPISTVQDKRKGKGKAVERETSVVMMMMMMDEDEDADADVSMRDVSMTDVAMDDILVDSPSIPLARRREMPPPPIPADKMRSAVVWSPSGSGLGTASTSYIREDRGSAQDANLSRSTSSALERLGASSEPEVKFHPLLVEKQRLKELKMQQPTVHTTDPDISNAAVADSLGGPMNHLNTPSRAPITRSTSSSNPFSMMVSPSFYSSQSPAAPGLTQSRHPPRLGMVRTRTAPLPTSDTPASGSTTHPAPEPENTSKKDLVKPFKPPTRVASGPPSRRSASHTADDVNASNYSNRTAYPSPSPGSDSDGKKRNEKVWQAAEAYPDSEEYLMSTIPTRRGRQDHLPDTMDALPPTPESISKGGVSVRSGTDRNQEQMEGLEAMDDPDSSFGDVTFDFSMDALEATMKMYD